LKQRLCCRETLDRADFVAERGRSRKSITAAKIRKDAFFVRATVLVMPALVAGIHVFAARVEPKTWMAGTSPAMTVDNERSRDGAERNPGLPRGVDAAPDFAPLQPATHPK